MWPIFCFRNLDFYFQFLALGNNGSIRVSTESYSFPHVWKCILIANTQKVLSFEDTKECQGTVGDKYKVYWRGGKEKVSESSSDFWTFTQDRMQSLDTQGWTILCNTKVSCSQNKRETEGCSFIRMTTKGF